MASVTISSSSSSADIIKASCASTVSCSPEVLTQLRDLLNPPAIVSSKSKAAASKTTKTTKVLANANAKGNKVAKGATIAKSTGIAVPCKAVLTPQERTKLATEIVNLTLKTLSSSLKSTTPASANTPKSKDALQQQAPLRKTVHSKSTVSSSTSSSSKRSPAGDQCIAECCRVAISFLHDCAKEQEANNADNLAVESAHSNLIAKLLSLSMHDAAFKEIVQLKRRLFRLSGKAEEATKKEAPVLSLLDWREVCIADSATPLAITCQIHALRLMSASKKLEAIARLFEYLSFTNCPEQLIKRQAAISKPKALKNLEALAGSITGCAQALTSSIDENPQRLFTIFQLQTKAIGYTLLAADLEGGESKRKPILISLEMTVRSLNTLNRKATPELLKDNYSLVKRRIETILSSLEALKSAEVENSVVSKFIDIYRLLTNFAQEAGAWDDGLQWNDESLQLLDGRPKSVAVRAAVVLRSGTLALKQFNLTSTIREKVYSHISAALEALKAPLSGSAEDLDRFIQEVLLLRRGAVSITAKAKIDDPEITDVCRNIVFSAVTFYKKCRVAGIAFAQTPAKAEKTASSTVECAVAIIKTTFDPLKGDAWENADQRLQECFALGKAGADNAQDSPTDTSIFERVSSAYAHIAVLYRRENKTNLTQAITALKRSVKVMQDRPIAEKSASNLTEKLYRLADYYYQNGDILRAEEYVDQCLSCMIELGQFDAALGAAAHLSTNSNASVIFKALRLRTQCSVLMGRPNPLWDHESLDADVRGKLLECQVNIMLGLQDAEAKPAASAALRYILDTIYTAERPIRRARLISQYLSLATDNPDRIGPQEASKLGSEAAKTLKGGKKSLKLDTHLEPQFEYTTAMVFNALGLLSFAHGTQKIEYIQLGLDLLLPLIDSCKSDEELVSKVDDLGALNKQLCTVIDLLEVKGHGHLRVKSLKAMATLHELTSETSQGWLKWQTMLGLQYHRIGHTGKAGLALAKAEVRMKKDQALEPEVKLRWHLAYAEYLAGIGNVDKGLESFSEAASLFNPDALSFPSSSSKLEKKIASNFLVGNACYVLSLLLIEKGDATEALRHGKRAVKLMQRVWAGLENLSDRNDNDRIKIITKGLEALSTREASQPRIHTTTTEALRGPQLWPAVQSLYSHMAHLSALYWHQGMSREADYYMEQALNIAQAVEAIPTSIHALSLYGALKVKQGLSTEGVALVNKAEQLRSGSGDSFKEMVFLDLTLGDLHRRSRAWSEEFKFYEQAEGTLTTLINELRVSSDDVEKLTEGFGQLSTTDSAPTKAPARRGQAKPTRAKSVSKKVTAKAPAAKTAAAKTQSTKKEVKEGQVAEESVVLSRMKGDVLRRKALNKAIQNESDQAESLLQQAIGLPGGPREAVSQHIATARSLLIRAQAAIDDDGYLCVLEESAIAIPSICSAKLPPPTPAKSKKPRKQNNANETTSHIANLLIAARDELAIAQDAATEHCASTVALEVSSLMTSIMVLISAISPEKADAPILPAYYSERNKGLASERERRALAIEKEEASSKEDLNWPVYKQEVDNSPAIAYTDFQKEYIDIIPPRWAVVSMSLGENKKELLITRYQCGQTPFLLRLPFERHLFEDEDESLEFDEVEELLRDIHERANSSTHAAKEKTTKATRVKWWEEREELDGQLGDLLEGIESKWFCGFKGILSQGPRYSDLVAKFAASFTKILNKHLPSRRKKGAKTNTLNLDHRILDLFLSVGDPRDEEFDLEHPLQDLIQFVVDVLKFHGEENAYNEIDMDDVVVDLTEALRAYHELRSKVSSEPDVEVDHTVLILDKHLQMFPWESLPCFDSCSVSRLPSLASLRERLVMQAMKVSDEIQGYVVDKSNGSYILNPSNDLVSTQNMFKDNLEALQNWDGIVQRPPREDEFKRALEEKDVVMYFGHGSGAQYIPGRTIKKLDKCAVTLLLGCSSGALKDAGDFEPYGMPVNYLNGGCPSLVAMLWDVTDKDIDKFSMTVLQKWGLVPEEDGSSEPNMSLTAAVAEGRKSCKLRYLNGAAPVVYGIPAYIS